MLTPTVTYLGPAHPERDSAPGVVSPGHHVSPELQNATSDAPRQRTLRTPLNLELVGLLTTIAMFALPAADALATGSWR